MTRFYLNDAVMMFKCVGKLVSGCRREIYLNTPRCCQTTGQRSFTYRGPRLWNDLNADIKCTAVQTVKVFRARIIN